MLRGGWRAAIAPQGAAPRRPVSDHCEQRCRQVLCAQQARALTAAVQGLAAAAPPNRGEMALPSRLLAAGAFWAVALAAFTPAWLAFQTVERAALPAATTPPKPSGALAPRICVSEVLCLAGGELESASDARVAALRERLGQREACGEGDSRGASQALAALAAARALQDGRAARDVEHAALAALEGGVHEEASEDAKNFVLLVLVRGCGASARVTLGARRAVLVEAPAGHTWDARADAAAAAAVAVLRDEAQTRSGDGDVHTLVFGAAGRPLTLRFALADVAPHERPPNGEDDRVGVSWRFDRVHNTLLAPLSERLAPVGELVIEAEALRHLPAAVGLMKRLVVGEDDNGAVVRAATLPTLVSVLSEALSPDVAAGEAAHARELRFALIAPPPASCPLRLELPSERLGNAVLVKGWGGLATLHESACASAVGGVLSDDALEVAMGAFYAQLRAHLGLDPAGPAARGAAARASIEQAAAGFEVRAVSPGVAGLAAWEAALLAQRRYIADASAASASLAQLASAAGGAGDFVARRVPRAVARVAHSAANSLRRAQDAAARGELHRARREASAAAAQAYSALMDGSLHNQPYFPLEHAVAVYVPFFAPLLPPLASALVRELRLFRGRRAAGSGTRHVTPASL